jgi:hypothetical protein
MNAIELAKALGVFSLALGSMEMMAGRWLSRALGLPLPAAATRGFGLREIGTGAMILTAPDAAWPVWLRVAGDGLDLGVLAEAVRRTRGPRRQAAMAATAAVLGVTVLDVLCAASLGQRGRRAQQTAARTRVA